MSLALRVVNSTVRAVEKTEMTVFECLLVGHTGHYCCAAATLFGPKRAEVAEGLRKKWEDGRVFQIGKFTMKRKDVRYHSAPHGFVLNIADEKITRKLKDDKTSEAAIPKEAEPPMSVRDLLELPESQPVDACGIITSQEGPVAKKEKMMRKAIVSDATGNIDLNFWEEMISFGENLSEGNVLYFYSVQLVVTAKNSRHLSFKKGSKIVVASGTCPRAKALQATDLAAIPDSEKENLSKWDEQDWQKCMARSTNLATLDFATVFKKQLPDTLFEVSGALVTLTDTDADKLLTRDKARLYAKVTVTDYANTVEADLTEEAALVLSGCDSKEDFVKTAASGYLALYRARIRLRWACPQKGGDPKMTIVAALPMLFDPPEPHKLPATSNRILPVQLQWTSMSTSGKIAVKIPGSVDRLLATGILILVVALKDAVVESMETGFEIRNYVADVLNTEPKVQWAATTTSITARVTKYGLVKNDKALVHVTYVNPDKKEMTIADVWKLQLTDKEEDFRKEVAATVELLMQPAHALKRKSADFDDTLQGLLMPAAKRVHAELGATAADHVP